MPLRRPLSAPSYTPPPAPSQPQHYACSWCAAPWVDGHVCDHKPLTEAQVAAAVQEGYLRGAQDALHRAMACLSAEDKDVLADLLADYAE